MRDESDGMRAGKSASCGSVSKILEQQVHAFWIWKNFMDSSRSAMTLCCIWTCGISLKSEMLFYDRAMVLRSYPAMIAGGWASATVPASNVRPDQSRRTVASRSRRLELRAKTARLVVVLSLFLMLIAAAVFIGGQSVIGLMLQEAMAQTRDRHRTGAIVFTMPDGTFCRHLAFDNKTAELRESTVLQCSEARPRDAAHTPSGFAWGAH